MNENINSPPIDKFWVQKLWEVLFTAAKRTTENAKARIGHDPWEDFGAHIWPWPQFNNHPLVLDIPGERKQDINLQY